MLTEGTYFINRLFATVELIPKTVVEVGYAGVVVSYYGEKGEDLSGEEYRHGELVAMGNRGVWSEPLMPGKYAFNTYAGSVDRWCRPRTSSSSGSGPRPARTTTTRTSPRSRSSPRTPSSRRLPLSVVIHIDYQKAPLVIQRFGDIKTLVNQTLDPMVSAYFKNIGQTKTLIELIQQPRRDPGEVERRR